MAIFDLPSDARPERDTPVGQDELGRMVYRTASGRQYAMPERPKPVMMPRGPMQGPQAYASPQRMAEMSAYASDLRGMQGSYSTQDIAAAGYSPMEVAAFSTAGQPAMPFSQQMDRDRQRAPADVLQEPDYTMRQEVTYMLQDELILRGGMDAYEAGKYARRVMGDPNAAGILESMGLIDFAALLAGRGAGIAARAATSAPAALVGAFNVQEGGRAASRGYQQGDPLTTALGAVQAAAGMAEMFPAGKMIAEGIARNVSRMDPNTLFSVFGPPIPPQPVRAPDTGAGAGRPPLTFDEVDRAMQEAPAAPITPAMAPEPTAAPPVTMESAALPPPPTSPDALPAPPQALLRQAPAQPAPQVAAPVVANLVSKPERAIIKASVPKANLAPVQEQVAGQKASYPAADGWANVMQVSKVNVKEFKAPKRKENETNAAYAARVSKARDKHEDKFEVEYKEVPYNFDRAPMGVSQEDWQRTMASRQVNEIKLLADRVKAGDPAAIAIVNEANWYRAMRTSLRKEFGGMGDVFADVLGATSAQTGVEMNWNNAIEVMRRFSRGEFDEELRMYDEMLKKGEANPVTLTQMHKDPDSPFRLVTNAAGSLFNANSPSATKALFDMFRVATGAPKTPNFTGNLIGYTNAATIDVWAARHLRRLAGLDRLPPPVEKGVVGDHLKGSTLEKPKIGGEFGFGQRVMADAADQINKQGIIRSVAPNLQDMNPDDLQAVAWFIEKEKWTNNGWTNKAGEGGSFEFESSLAGAPDPAAVKELRRATTASFKAPNKRVKETEAEYAARVEEARAAHSAGVVSAQKQLDEMKAPLARYVLGISVERPGMRPTNVQQADIAARLGEPAKADPSVVTYQINNTYGRFMQSDERAFNAEFVVRKNFDPAGVTRRMVEVAKEADQDAAFISKVMPQRTAESRPGVEVYFRNRQDPDFARRLSDRLTQYGVDGFTFVTDSRVMDRPSAQAGMADEAVAGINGLRFQYIPEFDMGRDAWAAMSPAEKAAKIDEVEDLFMSITEDIQKTEQGISAANLMHYETNVIERDQYDGLLGTRTTASNGQR
jgi:hypothetical protein